MPKTQNGRPLGPPVLFKRFVSLEGNANVQPGVPMTCHCRVWVRKRVGSIVAVCIGVDAGDQRGVFDTRLAVVKDVEHLAAEVHGEMLMQFE